MAIAPLAQTTMDRKSSNAMRNYQQKLKRMLDNLTPWASSSQIDYVRRKHSKNMGDGQVIVLLDAHDTRGDPLFKGAHIGREA